MKASHFVLLIKKDDEDPTEQQDTVLTGEVIDGQSSTIQAMINGEREVYAFFFNKESRSETLLTLGKLAGDSEKSFSWFNAAVVSQKIRETVHNLSLPIEKMEEAEQDLVTK